MRILLSTMKFVCMESFFEHLRKGRTLTEIGIRMDLTEKEVMDFINWIEDTVEECENQKYN